MAIQIVLAMGSFLFSFFSFVSSNFVPMILLHRSRQLSVDSHFKFSLQADYGVLNWWSNIKRSSLKTVEQSPHKWEKALAGSIHLKKYLRFLPAITRVFTSTRNHIYPKPSTEI